MINMVVYFFALIFMGIGYIAILPPFEGFDETAHYSSLREIADTKKIPVYGESHIDRTVTEYKGPTSYDSGKPPFDRGLTYFKFFNDQTIFDTFEQTYRREREASAFLPSTTLNWQAQHPPLYYVLLAPLEKLTSDIPLVTQLIILRLVSFIMAVSGVALSFIAYSRSPIKKHAALGIVLYPVVFPMFFPEFTRIGNDSLCLLLCGILSLLIPQWLPDRNDKKLAIAIGFVLGLGLLTKAFFLPIALGLFLFLATLPLTKRVDDIFSEAANLKWIFGPALIIGSGWYVYKLTVYGDLIGSADAIMLSEKGGVLPNLISNFSLKELIRGLSVTAASWSWAGTWSLVRMPAYLQMPVVVLDAAIIAAFLIQLRRRPLDDILWLPVWLFAVFGLGLLYHIILSLAELGIGNTPGWYLHILFPWAAPAVGVGISFIWKYPRLRPVLSVLVVYAALFQIMAIWSQLSLFTGCSVKANDKSYLFTGNFFCLDQAPIIISRLSVYGWPRIAALGFTGTLLCVGFLSIACGRLLRNSNVERP